MLHLWETRHVQREFWWGNQNERGHRRRWEDNIKMDVEQVGWGGRDWIDLAQYKDKKSGSFECGNEVTGSVKCGKFLD
jgi:hypothetical protein